MPPGYAKWYTATYPSDLASFATNVTDPQDIAKQKSLRRQQQLRTHTAGLVISIVSYFAVFLILLPNLSCKMMLALGVLSGVICNNVFAHRMSLPSIQVNLDSLTAIVGWDLNDQRYRRPFWFDLQGIFVLWRFKPLIAFRQGKASRSASCWNWEHG